MSAGPNGHARSAEQFLRALYGDDAPGHLAIWELEGRSTRWFAGSALGDAAREVASLAEERNVYFGVGLQSEARGPGERGKADGVLAIPGLWADIDVLGAGHRAADLPPSTEAALALLQELPLQPTAIVHSGHGVQVWWAFRELWVFESGAERARAVALALGWQAYVQAAAMRHGWHVDSTADLARVLRLPGSVNRKLEPAPVRMLAGGGPRYNPDDFAPFVVERAPAEPGGMAGTGLPDDLAVMLGWVPADIGHDDWIRVGMALHFADPVAGLAAWDAWSRTAPRRYPGVREIQRRWASFSADRGTVVTVGTLRRMAADRGYVAPRGRAVLEEAQPGADEVEEGLRDLTHDGLALELGDQWRDDSRYVAPWGQWLFYGEGTWRRDETLQHMTRARIFLRARADALGAKYEAAKKALRDAKMVAQVVGLARSNRAQAATSGQWDADPWALGTRDGTMDLRSGELKPARPLDYITKTTAVPPAPVGTDAPLWLAFLRRITGESKPLERYLQRFAGYALTGSVEEHAFAFGYGTGANGKSVFLGVLHGILGDYACTVPTEVLMVSQNERHPTELARLRGVRLAVVSETEGGKRWAEAKIKSLTGGDPIAARYMRQDFFEFAPQFKLFVVGNHRPSLRGVDEAMRRRLHCVPFTVTIPPGERDHELPAKLREEWPAILRWAVEGCLLWQEQGLAAPEIVRNATAEYLDAEDAFGQWAEECTERGVYETPAGVLFASWRAWAERAAEHVGTQKGFAQTLAEHGYEARKGSVGVRMYRGLRLRVDPREEPAGRDNY